MKIVKKQVAFFFAIAVGVAVLFFLATRSNDGTRREDRAAVVSNEPTSDSLRANVIPTALDVAYYGKLSPAEKAKMRMIWSERYDVATEQLNHYKDLTRYPHHSRPASDAADQIYPFATVESKAPMRNSSNQVVEGVNVVITQDRIFLNDAESVLITLKATQKSGEPLPVTVVSSQMIASADSSVGALPTPARVNFDDSGPATSSGADAVAGDGVYSARFTPRTQGFGSYRGTIRLHLSYLANGKEGKIYSDVIYTPGSPGSWGGIREVLENGSLSLYLKVKVNTPGRFVAAGLLDDANGKPYALLRFNEELAEGDQEIKLQLFGALVHDKLPKFPLSLRDVNAFLLLPDVNPDRALLPRRSGVVHVTRGYSAADFSDQEWTSDERERYLAQYGRAVDTSLNHLSVLNQ